MRNLSTPLAPSTFGPGGGKKKGKIGGGKCHTKSTTYYSMCGPKKKKNPANAPLGAKIASGLPIMGGIAAGIAVAIKKNK
jgi:hypothetical protein